MNVSEYSVWNTHSDKPMNTQNSNVAKEKEAMSEGLPDLILDSSFP